MNHEALKIFSDELANDLKAKLQDQATVEFVDTVKASGDDRSFEVVMSTSDEDRQGDSLDQSTWDFKYYNLNPVVLWAHNYQSFPIGVVTNLTIQGDKTIATGKFAPAGVNADADMACALYQLKFLRAVSPGYIQNDDGTRELLEMSFCPVPAGRNALSMRALTTLGISRTDLVTKGFFYEEKEAEKKAEEIGDDCELEDGSLGTLGDDPENLGTLICVPKAEKAQEEPETDETMNEPNNEEQKAAEEQTEAVAETVEQTEEAADTAEADAEKTVDEATVKAGASISAKNKEILNSVIKALEALHEEHGKSTNDVIASLKDLIGSPQDDEGKEQKPEKAAAPKQRSSPPVVAESKTDETLSEFEAIMLGRQVLKGVYEASGAGLAKIKQALREKYPDHY